MRYIFLVLPFLMHAKCTRSEIERINHASLQACQNNDLEFHKPKIKGVIYWLLIPTEARFQIAQKIVARIPRHEKQPQKDICVESVQEAMQLVERTATRRENIEWFFCKKK